MRKTLQFILVSVLLFFFILSIKKSFYYTYKYGGTDIRCRIVGSRLLNTNKSPYFFKWHNGEKMEYLDPNDKPYRKVNGNVVTPALLLLNKPLSVLSYHYIRTVWTVLQYLFLISSVLLICSVYKFNKTTVLSFLLVLAAISATDCWQLNIERGQTYVFYTFIFSLMYFFYSNKKKYGHLIAGIITGITIWLRPMFVFVNVPFLLVKNYKWIMGAFIGFVVGLIVFFVPLKSTWMDYFTAMKYYESEALGEKVDINVVEKIDLPQKIEGVTNITIWWNSFTVGCLGSMQQFFLRKGIKITLQTMLFYLGVVIVVLSFFYYKKIIVYTDNATTGLFLFAFLMYIIAELFIVSSRGGYNGIQWLFPFVIIINNWKKNIVALLFFIVGILFMNGLPLSFTSQYAIGEGLLFLGTTISIFYKKVFNKAIFLG